MKKRILRTAGGLTVGLTATMLLLLALNIALFGFAAVYLAGGDSQRVRVSEYANALEHTADGVWSLPQAYAEGLRARGCWAMLLDGGGSVVWSQDLPAELSRVYSVRDVASWTRWYLNDWPVKVWIREDGLFVLGQPKGSVWKYMIEFPLGQLAFWPLWGAAALLLNVGLLLALAVGVTRRGQRRRDAARSEWIAGISHDVRTPLSMVLGYAAALEEAPDMGADQRRMAGLIRQKGVELRGLIENLNLTNRLEYAMQPLNREWLLPAAIVREAAAACLNEDLEGRWPIEAVVSPRAASARLLGDRRLLLRMLQNLLRNSIRHNPGGCAITLSLDVRHRRLALAVSDTGRGFTKEQLARLNAGIGQPDEGGHGLGLRIVRGVAEAHGGHARFANAPGGGSRCTVSGLGPLRRGRKGRLEGEEG